LSDQSQIDTVDLPPIPSLEWPATLSSLVRVDLAALSHQGKVRRNNEDHFLAARLDRTMQTLLTNLPTGHVPERCSETIYGMLVADGMGGAAAGEVASRMAISALVDLVLQTPDWIMSLDAERSRVVLQRMARRYQQVNEILTERARTDPSLYGMGTTMTLTCSLGADMIVGHLGDSRAYLFRQGQLHRLTRDHTVAQALAERGAIRPEEAATHPLRHILTEVIGTKGGTVHADLHRLGLVDGDQVLLCTDGLTEMVTEAAIAKVLEQARPAADACATLIEMALEGGGKDNVTVVLGRYDIPEG
jgi:protein phosphatase